MAIEPTYKIVFWSRKRRRKRSSYDLLTAMTAYIGPPTAGQL